MSIEMDFPYEYADYVEEKELAESGIAYCPRCLNHRTVFERGEMVLCPECKPAKAYRHSWNGAKQFYYHASCIEQSPRNEKQVAIGEGTMLQEMPLEHVPADAQCDFCYAPVHGEPKRGEQA